MSYVAEIMKAACKCSMSRSLVIIELTDPLGRCCIFSICSLWGALLAKVLFSVFMIKKQQERSHILSVDRNFQGCWSAKHYSILHLSIHFFQAMISQLRCDSKSLQSQSKWAKRSKKEMLFSTGELNPELPGAEEALGGLLLKTGDVNHY